MSEEYRDELTDHNYDGIQEYDNPMPRWWILTFIFTSIWGGLYMIATGFDIVPEYHHELAADQKVVADAKRAREANLPPIDAEMLDGAVADAESAERGKQVFMFNCASCHNSKGQGLIGPNLTDTAFLYDSSPLGTFGVIRDGTRKGMPDWGNKLSRQEQLDVVAFVVSIRGSNPDNPKKPEGKVAAP